MIVKIFTKMKRPLLWMKIKATSAKLFLKFTKLLFLYENIKFLIIEIYKKLTKNKSNRGFAGSGNNE